MVLPAGLGPAIVGLVDRRSVQIELREHHKVTTRRLGCLLSNYPETAFVFLAAPRVGDRNADGLQSSHTHQLLSFVTCTA